MVVCYCLLRGLGGGMLLLIERPWLWYAAAERHVRCYAVAGPVWWYAIGERSGRWSIIAKRPYAVVCC